MRQIFFSFMIFLLIIIKVEIKSQVVFNEILASNASANLSKGSKNYVDWIELYNSGDSKVEIGGWFLSDDISAPTKWEIPYYISILPNSYEVFWADGQDFSNHLNFKLDKKGETLYLFSNDTLLIDSLAFTEQVSDISYGRVINENNWIYFKKASPGAPNIHHGVKELRFCGLVEFSKTAGFYKKSVTIELSAQEPNSEIFYTLDGSIPSENSNLYKEAIHIKENTVLRARAYASNLLPGKTSTNTYFIKENSKLPVISLSTDPKNLWDNEYGMYVPGPKEISKENWDKANYFQPWERPINIEFFDKDKNICFNESAGARIHGRSSRTFPQKSLAVFFRKKYGNDRISYKIFPDRDYVNLKSFLLRNSGNDWGVKMFHDALIHSLVINKIDVDVQAYLPAIVFINGVYWGIHNIREKININYLAEMHDISTKKIDIIESDSNKPKLVVLQGDMSDYSMLCKFMENNDMSNPQVYSFVKENIDINEFINYLCVQIFIVNSDFPGSNMKIWKEKSSGAKWRCALYDTEFSLGHFCCNHKSNIINVWLEQNKTEAFDKPKSNYLIRKLFKNEEFRTEFVQRTCVYLNTIFKPKRVFRVIDSLKMNIKPEVRRNIEKWGGIKQTVPPEFITSGSVKEWEANINFIKKFITHRAEFVRKNLMKQFGIKDTIQFELKTNDSNAGKVSLMGYTLPDGEFNGQVFSGIPIRIEAIPNKGYEFVKWKEEDLERKCSIILESDKKLTAIFEKK